MIGSATAAATTAAGATDPREAQLRSAAEAFEAVFLRQLIGSMRQAKLADDDLFGSQATEQFRDMADARMADGMANQGSFGIADLLLQQFRAVMNPAQPAGQPSGQPPGQSTAQPPTAAVAPRVDEDNA